MSGRKDHHPQSERFRSTPICRCRVLYLGSSVPHLTKDGLQAIQEPLQELYPEDGRRSVRGIDSWLSVWSNGLLLENLDENQQEITRFFPIEALHYCAAVRYVVVSGPSPEARFLPLDSPFARGPNPVHSPLFACVLRRTTGIKVLECHAFLCRKENSAHALVRCCFHAYADNACARQLEDQGEAAAPGDVDDVDDDDDDALDVSTMSLRGSGGGEDASPDDERSTYDGDQNHKVWAGPASSGDHGSTLRGGGGGGVAQLHHHHQQQQQRARQITPEMASPLPPPPGSSALLEAAPSKLARQKRSKHAMAHGSYGGARSPALPKQRQQQQRARGGANGPYVPIPNGYHHHHHHHAATAVAPQRNLRTSPVANGHHVPPPAAFLAAPFPAEALPHGPSPLVVAPYPMHLPPMAAAAPKVPCGWLPAAVAPEELCLPPPSRSVTPIYAHVPEELYLRYAAATANRKLAKEHHRKRKEEQAAPFDDPVAAAAYGAAGIYRKKGHLNERAFSYSIRQEHRSRSYGSIANLAVVDGGAHAHPPDRRNDLEKMIRDLDISGNSVQRVQHHQQHGKKKAASRS